MDAMARSSLTLSCVFGLFVACTELRAQDARPTTAGTETLCASAPRCCASCGCLSGLHWTRVCFPRCGCPDDYCPNPYPRQCWMPYPPFYRCVPAGDCSRPRGDREGKDRLTWWFI